MYIVDGCVQQSRKSLDSEALQTQSGVARAAQRASARRRTRPLRQLRPQIQRRAAYLQQDDERR